MPESACPWVLSTIKSLHVHRCYQYARICMSIGVINMSETVCLWVLSTCQSLLVWCYEHARVCVHGCYQQSRVCMSMSVINMPGVINMPETVSMGNVRGWDWVTSLDFHTAHGRKTDELWWKGSELSGYIVMVITDWAKCLAFFIELYSLKDEECTDRVSL